MARTRSSQPSNIADMSGIEMEPDGTPVCGENPLASGIVAEKVPSPWGIHCAIERFRGDSLIDRWGNSTAANPCHLPRMFVPPLIQQSTLRALLERRGTFCEIYKFPGVCAPLIEKWELSAEAASKLTAEEYRVFVIARQKALDDKNDYNSKQASSRYGPARQRTPPLALRRNVLVGYSRVKRRSVALVKKTLKRHLQYTRRSILKKAIPSTRTYKYVPSKRFHRKKKKSFVPESMDSNSQYSCATRALPSTLSSDWERNPEDTCGNNNLDDPLLAATPQLAIINVDGPPPVEQPQPNPYPNHEPQDIYGIPVMPLEPNSEPLHATEIVEGAFDPTSEALHTDELSVDSQQPYQLNNATP